MGYKASQCNKTSIPECIFLVTSALEGWATIAKEATFKTDSADTKPVYLCCGVCMKVHAHDSSEPPLTHSQEKAP